MYRNLRVTSAITYKHLSALTNLELSPKYMRYYYTDECKKIVYLHKDMIYSQTWQITTSFAGEAVNVCTS